MRTFLLIVGVLISQLGLRAQGVATATLHHGEEIKTFYSATAFRQALAEAQPGDIINLSEGSFKGGIIEVPVCIKGIGIGNLDDSTSTRRARTIISDQIILNIPTDDAGKTLSMEGMECATLSFNEIHSPIFSKMRFNRVDYSQGDSKMDNLTFVHCIIGEYLPVSDATCQFFNCVLPGFLSSGTMLTLNNCIVFTKNYHRITDESVTCNNCIIYTNNDVFSSNTMTNCVAIGGTEDTFRNRNAEEDRNNRLFPSDLKVFKDNTYYQLTDEAAKYLGSDGTQVGIYGSSLPFSVKTSYPQIKKFTVAPESTTDGKLKIEIEIDENNE